MRLPPPCTHPVSTAAWSALIGAEPSTTVPWPASSPGAERPDVGDVELVEALAAQDLGHVAAEAVGVRGEDQDRSTGRRGNGCRGGGPPR